MKIFYRRPLSLILCIMLGAFSVFSFLATKNKYCLFILPPLLLIISFLPIEKIVASKSILRLISITILISLVASHIYFDLWFKAYSRFEDEEVKITATVESEKIGEFYTSFTLISDNISGERHSSYKLLLTLENDEAKAVSPNTRIFLTGVIEDFEDTSADFNSNFYYTANGYSGRIEKADNIKTIEKTEPSISAKLSARRAQISEYIIKISDTKSGALFTALLLGDKSYLSPQLNLDFKRIGISHLLALSGMNLTILILGLSKLISLFGVGKKTRYIINIILTFLYMAITGFPVSVVRAGLMLIISSLLFLLAQAHDTMTTLFVSVALITLVNPYSVFDLGLWLSAFATLGILSLSEGPKRRKVKRSFFENLLLLLKNAVTVSLFAVGATFAITLTSFDSVSVISPISTIIFSVILELYFYVGIAMMLLGGLKPIYHLLAFLENTTSKLAAVFSEFEMAAVSSDFVFLKILTAIFTIAFFAFLILNVRHKKIFTGALSIFMCIILVSSAMLGASVKEERDFSYIKTEVAESFSVKGSGDFALIQEASYSLRTAYETSSLLRKEKIYYVESLILTDYNKAIPTYISVILSNILVKNIYIPEPENDLEREIFENVKKAMLDFRAKLTIYEKNEKLTLQNFEYELKYRNPYSNTKSLNAFNIRYGKFTTTYLSSGMLREKTKAEALKISLKSDNIIFGRHGVSYYNYNFVYLFENAEKLVFSSKNMYIPADVIKYYEGQGTEIFKSDCERISLKH